MNTDEGSWPPVDLAAFQEDLQGTCWWCGANADSLEHRHKRSDLVRLWDGQDGPVWGGEGGRTEVIRGPGSRSPAVRFGRILCQRCNNARSQPFDLAYDQFSSILVDEMDSWWARETVDLAAIFGREWATQALHLARYYVKNFGCVMADHGIRPPESMRAFLEGSSSLHDVALFLVQSESHHYGHARYFRHDGPNASLWRPPSLVSVSPRQGRFTGFEGDALVGYVGVRLRWVDDIRQPPSFFQSQTPTLHRIPAGPNFHDDMAALEQEGFGK